MNQTGKKFTANYQLKVIFRAIFILLLGLGMIFWPYRLFGLLVMILPWAAALCGLMALGKVVQLRKKRQKYYLPLLLAVVLLSGGGVLYWRPGWCDVVLWYVFAGGLFASACYVMQPVWMRGVERQIIWRLAGGMLAVGLAVLMLLKPRSGLSDALLLLGIFSVGWGFFQLLLPPPRE